MLKKDNDSDTYDEVIKIFDDRFVVKGSEMAQRIKFEVEGVMNRNESVDEFYL